MIRPSSATDVVPAAWATVRWEVFPPCKRVRDLPRDPAPGDWLDLEARVLQAGLGMSQAAFLRRMLWRASPNLSYPLSVAGIAADLNMHRSEATHIRDLLLSIGAVARVTMSPPDPLGRQRYQFAPFAVLIAQIAAHRQELRPRKRKWNTPGPPAAAQQSGDGAADPPPAPDGNGEPPP
jgi:hypothetical protein